MKLIKLKTALGDKVIYINPEQICELMSFEDEELNHTHTQIVDTTADSCIKVMETPEQIMALIEQTVNNWIKVEDEPPSLDKIVWLHNNRTGYIALGCRIYDNLADGYIWAESRGVFEAKETGMVTDCYIDDIEVTHWHPIPKLPEKEKK